MNVYFSQLMKVESLDQLPESVLIHRIDGKIVTGMCVVCDKPVFLKEDKIEENGNCWHKECGNRY